MNVLMLNKLPIHMPDAALVQVSVASGSLPIAIDEGLLNAAGSQQGHLANLLYLSDCLST